MEKIIYADHAATSPLSPEVLAVMMPYLTESYGNPSSLHAAGQAVRKDVEDARQEVVSLLGGENPQEIIFTSGGTEADNLAVKGFLEGSKKKHMITSKIEHPALLQTCGYLEKNGYSVTYLSVDKDGLISLKELEEAITPETALVSIMAANNEIGTIQPIKEIGQLCQDKGVIFHCDAVQAIGHVPINVKEMNIDMLSLSAHKLGGPKGAGVLYARRGIRLISQIHGGGQERSRRSGTESPANIIGTAKALSMVCENLEKNNAHAKKLSDRLKEGLLKIPYSHFTGHPSQRLSGTSSFVFEAIEGEGMLLLLDMYGICCSTGSACASGSLDPSHVLMAIGLPHEIAHGSLRITLNHLNTEEEVDTIIEKITAVVERLRKMSPIWNNE
ncbi:MAG: cysteine desulfurase NifS [Eubacteriales bacterium]